MKWHRATIEMNKKLHLASNEKSNREGMK